MTLIMSLQQTTLKRLHSALLSNRRNTLASQGKSEAKLLQSHKVEVPYGEYVGASYNVDRESVNILDMFHPIMNTAYIPIYTVGDGNCLYRAVSFALCGSDRYHLLLRLLTALELINHRSHYDTKKPGNDFLNDIRIITPAYDELVKCAVVVKSFSEMAHLYALSAATDEPIQSYYPPQIGPEMAAAYTKTVSGRNVDTKKTPNVMIMWTAMSAPKTLSFNSNHFVPLINKSITSPLEGSLLELPTMDLSCSFSSLIGKENDFDTLSTVSVSDIVSESSQSQSLSNIKQTTAVCLDQTTIQHTFSSFNSQCRTDFDAEEDTEVESVPHLKCHTTEFSCNSDSEVESAPHLKSCTKEFSCNSDLGRSSNTDSVINTASGSVLHPEPHEVPSKDSSNNSDSGRSTDTESATDTASASIQSPIIPTINQGELKSGFTGASNATSLLLRDTLGLDQIPSGSKENVFFLVNNTINLDKRANKKHSTFYDDRGVWDTSKGASPKSYYIMHENGELSMVFLRNGLYCFKKQIKKQNHYVPLEPQPLVENVVVLHRYYTSLKLDKSYKKRVSWFGEGGLTSKLALVEYVGKFPGLAPHGLSKTNEEFVRTNDKVMTEINQMVDQHYAPLDIYETLKDKYIELTRPNLTSIYTTKHSKKVKSAKEKGHLISNNISDQNIHLENLVTAKDDFVRSVYHVGGASPFIMLYTDDQIEDIKKLCCTGQTVLGIDKTFMLCRMHVTVTVYKQLSVIRYRTKKPPLFLGPMFIHDSSDYPAYSHFFHGLKVLLTGTDLTKLVIGSDDEKAMVKAIVTEFPSSTHVLCTRHMRQNTRHYLETEGVSEKDRKFILAKIFDDLANADDDICFNALSETISTDASKLSENFGRYFERHLVPRIKTKINIPIREGSISKDWTNNNCESINHVLKQIVDWETKSLPEFVSLVKRQVKGQFLELRSALCSSGNFRLADSHSQFAVPKETWIDMSDQQRTNSYRRYRQFVLKKPRVVISTDGQSSCLAPRTDGKKPGQRKRKRNVRTTSFKTSKLD